MANAKRDGAAPEEVRDLRSAIEWMKKEGDIIVTDQEVGPDLEITGIQKQLDGGCPILFNNVKGKPHHRCITNLFGDMNVINKMFGWKDHADRTRKLAYAITHPIAPIVVDQKDAPVQEEVYEKPAEASDFVVPIRHTNIEPELTVGSGNRLISGEYFNGGTDLGYNRMNFRWGNVGTFQISPGSHMWQVVSKYYKDNKMVPITMNFGLPPAGTLLAGAGFDYVILPQGCDEVGMAGAVQGAPMRLVKARTVDAYGLADAEVVLEGYVNPRDRRFETAESEKAGIQGRFHFHPEWAGYMGKAYKAPTFHVTAVTKRKRIEEGWQRNFMAAILATSQGSRLVIAVSEDSDPYDMDDIIWCLTTRVNPKTDIINPLPGGRGQTFMPAERMTAGEREWTASNTMFEGGMGIDATVPFGYESDFMRPVYPVDRVDLKKWFNEKEIQNAKTRMQGWVHSLARTGR